MGISRREFLELLAIASVAGIDISNPANANPRDAYDLPPFGNVSLLHFTDCHAQLLPVYFREPHINLGVGAMQGQAPHLVGRHLLKKYNIPENSLEAYAMTPLGYVNAARKYGKVGGFAHLATLVKKLRSQRPGSLLLDGGDNWQGSATSLWTRAQDMVDASLLLGVDIMTGHWEFTLGADRVKQIITNSLEGKMDFLAQNIVDNEWNEPVFKSYVLREINGVPVAIIGQAFPYTPIANPRHLIPDWSFGINEERMQETVDKARTAGAQVVVILSHNGMDVDLKMAGRVRGIDAILGGHTHDAVPAPILVNNGSGKTIVINSGSNGKFLSVLDMDVKGGKLRDFRFKLLPVFSNLLEPDKEMHTLIEKVRAPFKPKLDEKLAVTEDLLYRRGNFNGTFDQLILNAMMAVKDAEIAFSPGFRWGTTLLPGDAITFEHVMDQTSITYPATTLNEMTGERIKEILEDVADNLFNVDPYYQQGGDMVRVGGLKFTIDPAEKISKRISNMELKGKPIIASKKYKVAGWASVQESVKGEPIWDVVANYLRHKKTVQIKEVNVPVIKGFKNNPGVESV